MTDLSETLLPRLLGRRLPGLPELPAEFVMPDHDGGSIANLPSQVAAHASQMFSRNIEKLLAHLVKDGALRLDSADEITRGMLVTRGGEIVNPKAAELAAGGSKA